MNYLLEADRLAQSATQLVAVARRIGKKSSEELKKSPCLQAPHAGRGLSDASTHLASAAIHGFEKDISFWSFKFSLAQAIAFRRRLPR